jgi:DNA-binding CsgD family transcriptional regulator
VLCPAAAHVATTRNLLKRVFSKTGARRQSELATMLLRSPLIHGA